MIDLPVFAMQFSAFGRDLRRRSKEFLPRNQGRWTRLSQAVMQTTVYDVYSPVKYEHTGNLKESTIAYLPDPSNTKVMFIEPVWDARGGAEATSPAKLGTGGYGKYVAGEGPGIGFLARTVPSEFPRDFPEALFQAVEADALSRFQTEVVDKALLKL
jgi:hypothetical protein